MYSQIVGTTVSCTTNSIITALSLSPGTTIYIDPSYNVNEVIVLGPANTAIGTVLVGAGVNSVIQGAISITGNNIILKTLNFSGAVTLSGNGCHIRECFVSGSGAIVDSGASNSKQYILANGTSSYVIDDALGPVGSTLQSMLTQTQFQAQWGPGWVIADGSSCSGTTYAAVTGNSALPDLRGIFMRGKNNGRSDGNQDPNGDLPLGTYEPDQVIAHSHGNVMNPGALNLSLNLLGSAAQSNIGTSASYGGLETAPKYIVLNTFIRIN